MDTLVNSLTPDQQIEVTNLIIAGMEPDRALAQVAINNKVLISVDEAEVAV